VCFPVRSGKSHNIEQTLVVLDGLYANGTPLPEMFSYVVMLAIDPRVISGRLDHNRFANDEPSHFTSAMLQDLCLLRDPTCSQRVETRQ
jgi:hypothetical protein